MKKYIISILLFTSFAVVGQAKITTKDTIIKEICGTVEIDRHIYNAADDLEFQYYWDSGATNCKIDDIVMTIKRL